MKHDRQADIGAQGGPAATPAPAPGGERVQLKQALQGMSYAQQVQMVRARQPDDERASTEVAQPDAGPEQEEGAKPKVAEVTLSARSGGSPFSKSFWQDLDVGHCWVDIRKPGGRKDSWGYTAKDVGGFPRTRPWKTVGGKVLHPDGSRGATGTLTEPIDEDQLARGERWAESQSDKYNLFGLDGGHSCATFAKGFYEEASGKKAPTGVLGALVANPNSLSEAMNKHLEKERRKKAKENPDSPEEDTPPGDQSEG